MLQIGYKAAFIRSFKKLPPLLQDETIRRIDIFARNPEDPQLRTHKLKGRLRGKLSFSVDYKHRIVFIYESRNSVVLLDIGDHGVYD